MIKFSNKEKKYFQVPYDTYELIMKPQTNVIEQPDKKEDREINQLESDQGMRDDQDRDLSSDQKAQHYKEVVAKCLQQLKALKIPYQ